MLSAIAVLFFLLCLLALGYWILKHKNLDIWLWSYIRYRPQVPLAGCTHVLFCMADHFEPKWASADSSLHLARVRRWRTLYPEFAAKFVDADGVRPQHSFFYPAEEYEENLLNPIQELCEMGLGEIEVHLHHDNDTEENLRRSLKEFVETLHQAHGAFVRHPKSGKLAFGFIHGNYALDNARPDGRMCGVNNELDILEDMGCYADFTLPSAPSDTQTRKINSIYYAADDPLASKSHDSGVDVRVGGAPQAGLFMIQGPLGLDFKRRKFGLLPRIENADIRGSSPGSPSRVDLWVKQAVQVLGRPEWLFVKVHTHGTQEANQDALLGNKGEEMHEYLRAKYNDGIRYKLHYVTAREMFNIAKAAEAGQNGDPNNFRDYLLPRPKSSRTIRREQLQ